MPKPLDIMILAAGRGQRLRNNTPKPLLPLAAEPLIIHILNTATKLRPRRIIIVIAPNAESLQTTAQEHTPTTEFVVQKIPRGTGDAAKCGVANLSADGTTLILCADSPMLTAPTLRKLTTAANNKLALLTFLAQNPNGYGRIIRNNNTVAQIVEEKDTTAAQRQINEVFAGTLAAPTAWLQTELRKLRANNAANEIYLTDVATAAQQTTALIAPEQEAAGINTMCELAAAENRLRQQRTATLMNQGVHIIDPNRIDLRGQIRAAAGTTIDINVILHNTTIAANAHIGAHCVIHNCNIGAEAQILPFCHLHGATIGKKCIIGPFARLRPTTTIKTNARIGNFVEIKNTAVGENAKAGHLAYLGDATIGDNANIGAGVITCNYDGKQKHQTLIGKNAFVGSDSQLVAPVQIGQNAYIAAGTTLTKNAPEGHLTSSRMSQTSRRRRK